jgi:hypothetical protein
MSGFDAVYNEQCARIWNQPRSESPVYEIRRAGYYGDKFCIVETHEGWGIGVGGTYDTREEAEQFIKEYTA